MFVLAIVVIIVLQVLLCSRPRRANPLRHRLQPGGRPAVGSAGAAHDDRRLHGVRSARRPRRVPRARPLRHAHRVGRPGARAGVDRRCRRRRGQHARRLGDDRRQLLRRRADRPARPEHRSRARRSASSCATPCSGCSSCSPSCSTGCWHGGSCTGARSWRWGQRRRQHRRRDRRTPPGRRHGGATHEPVGRRRRRAPQPVGVAAPRDLRRHGRVQRDAVDELPRHRQLRQPVRAVDREGDHRRDDDVRDHRRGDRPVGRLGDGSERGGAGGPQRRRLGAVLARHRHRRRRRQCRRPGPGLVRLAGSGCRRSSSPSPG